MKLFNKNELRFLGLIYLDNLISPLLFFAPAFFIVYFSLLGFSFYQMGIIVSISFLFTFLFEVPTGAIADIYGRKFSVLLGLFLEGLVFLSLFFIKSFEGIILVFALWGIAQTFSSGSKEAWIYDLVKRKKNLSKSYFHKSQAFDAVALIISGIIGAYIVKIFGLQIIWLFGFASYMFSLLILSFVKDDHIRKNNSLKNSFSLLYNQTKKAINYGYKHPVLFYYLLASFVFTIALSFSTGISWTPYLLNLNFPEHYFGYLWSSIGLISVMAPIISSKFLKDKKEKKFIMICFFLSAIILSLVYLPRTWFIGLLVLLTGHFFIELRRPASRIYFHRFIPGKLRATMGSIDSLLSALAIIIVTPFSGFLIDKFGAKLTIILYLPLILIVIFLYSRIKSEDLKFRLK